MSKRGINLLVIVWVIVAITVIVSITGCFGGAPLDFKNQTDRYGEAVSHYNSAKNLYNKGNYTEAKAAFIQVIKEFQANKTAFETISKGNYTSKEKYIAENLVVNADQYSYAAAFMRDAADAAAAGKKDQAYAIELNADEFDQVSRLKYQDISEELRAYLNTRK
jgi:hypothetical protein